MTLTIITIYNRPSDYPTEVVARESRIMRSAETRRGDIVARGPTVKAVRTALDVHGRGLVCIPRHPTDAPSIVECWM